MNSELSGPLRSVLPAVENMRDSLTLVVGAIRQSDGYPTAALGITVDERLAIRRVAVSSEGAVEALNDLLASLADSLAVVEAAEGEADHGG